jgi:hypothetical protein
VSITSLQNITQVVTVTETDCVFSKVGITLPYKILINPDLQKVIQLLRLLIAGFQNARRDIHIASKRLRLMVGK